MASDRFPNILGARLTMSAADALTFLELQTGAALGLNLGILIDRIDYYPIAATMEELVADGDMLVMGLATSNTLTDVVSATDARLITQKRLGISAVTAAGLLPFELPFVEEYDPPLILAAPKLFLFGETFGFAAAGIFDCRIYFRYIKLTTQEYLELAEANLLLG